MNRGKSACYQAELRRVEMNWCQRQELNLRPKAYESSALPLSYSGNRAKIIFRMTPRVKCNDAARKEKAGRASARPAEILISDQAAAAAAASSPSRKPCR